MTINELQSAPPLLDGLYEYLCDETANLLFVGERELAAQLSKWAAEVQAIQGAITKVEDE